MSVVSETIWVPLQSVVSNTPEGPQSIVLDLPTVWNPTPFLEWNNPDWQEEDGPIHQGWRVALFKIRQVEIVRRPLDLPRTVECNRWLVQAKNPVFPEQFDQKIYTHDEVVAIFSIYLLECHPK